MNEWKAKYILWMKCTLKNKRINMRKYWMNEIHFKRKNDKKQNIEWMNCALKE